MDDAEMLIAFKNYELYYPNVRRQDGNVVPRRMKYSLYKRAYSQFEAHDYQEKDKTIIVDLPEGTVINHKLPDGWENRGNYYCTSGGCYVRFYNTGLAMNYYVENGLGGYAGRSKTISAGIDSFERMLKVVEEFEKDKAERNLK